MTMKMKKQGRVIKIYDGSPFIRLRSLAINKNFSLTQYCRYFWSSWKASTMHFTQLLLPVSSRSCHGISSSDSGTLITFMHTAPTGRTKWFEMLNRNIYILLSWVVSVRATCVEGNRLQIFWFQTIELAQQQHKFLNHSQICLWQQVPFWIILVQVDSGHDRPRLFLVKL